MTVSSTASSNDYIGDGTVSVYPYTYRIFKDSDLVVTKSNPTTGAETVLQLGVDYSVSSVGSLTGGSVLLSVVLATTWPLNIRRVLPLVQELDVRNQGTFLPENHERAFDKLLMIDQQQQIDISRSLRLGDTAAGVSTKLPAPVPLQVLRWNAAKSAIENADPGSVPLATPGDGTVTNPKLAAAPAGTVKANLTSAVATPTDATLAALKAAMDIEIQDVGGIELNPGPLPASSPARPLSAASFGGFPSSAIALSIPSPLTYAAPVQG